MKKGRMKATAASPARKYFSVPLFNHKTKDIAVSIQYFSHLGATFNGLLVPKRCAFNTYPSPCDITAFYTNFLLTKRVSFQNVQYDLISMIVLCAFDT